MTKIKKVITMVMACAMVSISAVSASAALIPADIPTAGLPAGLHYHAADVQAYAKCDHVGTEKTTKYIAQCGTCGGPLYQVNCKPCKAFVGTLCFCNM